MYRPGDVSVLAENIPTSFPAKSDIIYDWLFAFSIEKVEVVLFCSKNKKHLVIPFACLNLFLVKFIHADNNSLINKTATIWGPENCFPFKCKAKVRCTNLHKFPLTRFFFRFIIGRTAQQALIIIIPLNRYPIIPNFLFVQTQ